MNNYAKGLDGDDGVDGKDGRDGSPGLPGTTEQKWFLVLVRYMNFIAIRFTWDEGGYRFVM